MNLTDFTVPNTGLYEKEEDINIYSFLEGLCWSTQSMVNITASKDNDVFLPSSLEMLGLYQYLDVSFTNLGVVCMASESADTNMQG